MSFSRFNGQSSFTRFNQQTAQEDPLDRQIQNAETRIKDSGYSLKSADRRNWFEKATNLPQGQNWFFDALDLLGRPAQGVLNVLDKNNTMNAGNAFARGFSGEDKVRGSDLVDKAGIHNKVAKTVLGTGLEIALDPLTYVPGGVIAKGVGKGAGLAGKAVGGAYKAAEETIPSFARFSENNLRPAAENIKDGLGYMFKPDYKKDVTLTGGKSDFLKNAELDTENSRRFMKENAMSDLANTAKAAGGIDTGVDVGRIMEKDLQVNGPRPYRELSNDPQILQAADDLMKSNADIRNFAAEKGIDIPELSGYMTHILTQEEKKRRQLGKPFKIDVGSFGKGNPNKKILEKRKLEGSAEDINQQMGREFFNPNAYFATGVGHQRLLDYIHAVDFRRKVLSNPDFAQPFQKGMDVGKNVVIDSNNYKFLKESGDTLDGLNLADKVGGQYVVTPQVKMLLDRYQRMNSDEGTKAFMKAFDGLTGMWKKMALFSPGFHIRNVAGAMWNNYLAGMNTAQLGKYTFQGAKEVAKALRGKESAMYKEFRSQGLGSSGMTQVEFGSLREPEKGIQKSIENLSKDTKGKVLQRTNPLNAFNTSREVGELADQANRFALYKWAREKGMTPEQSAAKVREVQFDYSDLTPFEQKARRIIPFYTWSRKNIPFQLQQFVQDPRKFQNINRLRLNAQENVGLTDENIPDYMKESFAMPLYGSEGKGRMLGLNLPLSDLTKLSDPLKLGADSLTPLIKTPMELATNFNFFKGKPIEKFEGQTKQYLGGAQIPIKTAYGLEQLTGQIGRGLSDYLQTDNSVDQDNKFRTPSFGISSLAKPFDAEKYDHYAKLDQLKKLQDFILYIEQQEGAKPRTIAQIKKGQ
ncbi:hypothetical protein [Cohnella nanjingensis]|uniref:Large polyvalent protein associated domain-containing protein n=1 Tax=Cohnella nanjingensis TaxID=1387779 RepID=A0A7X0RS32_9BACL|nr:hypothetical protein [Cohnella nanjingensis]MBB6672632.1 hypothetical protein [Cohnella nanjingensis]